MIGTWSIRLRLTLWYSAMLLAGLALSGAGIWLVVSHSLRASLDDALTRQAQGVVTVLSMDRDDEHDLGEELNEYAAATPEGNLIEVRNARGRQLISSNSVTLTSAPQQAVFDEQSTPSGRYRTFTRDLAVGQEKYQILVATPLDGVEATLRRIRTLFLFAAPVVMLMAALGGYWISRRALAPVDALTSAARTIGIQNLSQRLSVPATGDELQRLSETWNDMLARLESAVKRLSQFTADASHELRTPIALIRTTAELALRRERSPEIYREALRQVVAESERTSHLVEDLLLLARSDAGLPAVPLERIELTPLVRDVCRQGQVLAEERQLQLSAEMPEHPVFVQGDDPSLRRLLLLLVDNAVKYTPAGGRITVSVRPDSGGAIVAVRDTGIGIPDTALPHVFERFYRVDESRSRDGGGSGLGLAIAKWIADHHRASLEAESIVGEGSVFRVRFPAS